MSTNTATQTITEMQDTQIEVTCVDCGREGIGTAEYLKGRGWDVKNDVCPNCQQ